MIGATSGFWKQKNYPQGCLQSRKGGYEQANTGYANRIQTELDDVDIIEGIDGVDEAFINEALPIMAHDARFKSDAEDIVSLYEHRLETKRQPEKV